MTSTLEKLQWSSSMRQCRLFTVCYSFVLRNKTLIIAILVYIDNSLKVSDSITLVFTIWQIDIGALFLLYFKNLNFAFTHSFVMS